MFIPNAVAAAGLVAASLGAVVLLPDVAAADDRLGERPVGEASWSDGRVAVVVAEGIDASLFRQALQHQLNFPIVPLTDRRATATSRRLLVVVEGTRVTFSLEDFGSNVWSESLTLENPHRAGDPIPEALQQAAVPLLLRASSLLFRRSEIINPFDDFSRMALPTEELLDPFASLPAPADQDRTSELDWIPGELLNPFEDEPPVPRSYEAALGQGRQQPAEGAHRLGRPSPRR